MQLGILPSVDSSGGGIYQYSLTMLQAIQYLQRQPSNRIKQVTVFGESFSPDIHSLIDQSDWAAVPFLPQSFKRRLLRLARNLGAGSLLKQLRAMRSNSGFNAYADPDKIHAKPALASWLRRQAIELMLYPAPTALSFESELPYIMAIHDLQHRLQPEFPEVSANGEWEMREYLFRNGARHALSLLADSEVGKEDILNFYGKYGVTEDRVKVLPFLPAHYLAVEISDAEKKLVRDTYHLPERFLFYPAQFWPHKNHARIIEALGQIKTMTGESIPVVFSGSKRGKLREETYAAMMTQARVWGIEGSVYSLGYVPNEAMSALYTQAAALIMPTFFGPTNIPVLEAWAFGCPVITSDIRGIREQCGDAAVLVDPRSAEAIAEGISRVWSDDVLRSTLVLRGQQRLGTYTFDDYCARLADILQDASARLKA